MGSLAKTSTLLDNVKNEANEFFYLRMNTDATSDSFEPGVYDKVIWLNPVPSDHWEYSASVELTRSLVEDNMFPLTIRGLEESMTFLSK